MTRSGGPLLDSSDPDDEYQNFGLVQYRGMSIEAILMESVIQGMTPGQTLDLVRTLGRRRLGPKEWTEAQMGDVTRGRALAREALAAEYVETKDQSRAIMKARAEAIIPAMMRGARSGDPKAADALLKATRLRGDIDRVFDKEDDALKKVQKEVEALQQIQKENQNSTRRLTAEELHPELFAKASETVEKAKVDNG